MECENEIQRADSTDSAEQLEYEKLLNQESDNRISEQDYTFKSFNNQSRKFMFNRGHTIKSTGGSSPKNKVAEASADGMSIRSAIWSRSK